MNENGKILIKNYISQYDRHHNNNKINSNKKEDNNSSIGSITMNHNNGFKTNSIELNEQEKRFLVNDQLYDTKQNDDKTKQK